MKVYNTLSGKKEEFKALISSRIGLYTCGPTVYFYAHIGNLRTYLFEDFLRRTFEYDGYEVKHIMNITDVGHLSSNEDYGEDKMEASARKSQKTAWEIADFYTQAFVRDLKRLNILMPDVMPKATDHIQEQIELIKILEKKGYTYKISDGIYFDVERFSAYGKLSKQKLDEKAAGARVEVNPEKRHPADFALWKFSAPDVKRQMEWSSPWVDRGFPGWHIECSAMATKYLGQPFDIHCGGIDHVPVHHENEIAQSEAAFGKPLANYWLHSEFMLVDSKRMGKSEGNAFMVDDLIKKGIEPLAFRYLCLNTHYRIQLNFTWEALAGAEKALHRLREHIRIYKNESAGSQGKPISNFHDEFTEFLNDDFNIPGALGVLWQLIHSKLPAADKLATILDFDKVFGLELDKAVTPEKIEVSDEIMNLIQKREKARKVKDWAASDRIRNELLEKGIQLEDTPEKTLWKKVY